MASPPCLSPLGQLGQEPKGCKEVYLSTPSSKVRLAVRKEIWVVPALRREARWDFYNILGHLRAKSDPGCSHLQHGQGGTSGACFDGTPLEAKPELRGWLNKRFSLVLCGSRALQSLWSAFRSHHIAVLSCRDAVPANPTFIVCSKVSLWSVQCYRMGGIVNLADRFRSKKPMLAQNPNAFHWISSLCFFLLFRYDTAVKSEMPKYHVKANLWYVCGRVL